MSKTRVWCTLGCCLFAVAVLALAQTAKKPGLWEMTSNMTWQKSPLPPGITLPPGVQSPFGGGPHTSQVCVTQAMIDKYGAPMPQGNNGCKVSNVVMKSTSMTADWICTGKMAGKGTVEASWTDANHSTSKVHFTGVMQDGRDSMPVEYTIDTSSNYKGADCGKVKPMPMSGN